MTHPPRARRALVTVLAAQFLSSLADNALLVAAIGLLAERHAPSWMTPALRMFFYLAYVVLAAVAGAVADAVPKARVILGTSVVKLGGCLLLLAHLHPLLAYTFVGMGAAAYSPAKYGILPELLPTPALVAANAWMESLTVLSIILGVGLGSALLQPWAALHYPSLSDAHGATAAIAVIYLLAMLFAAAIPAHKPAGHAKEGARRRLLHDFMGSQRRLWTDAPAATSLAVTSLFWAVSAVLQFIVLRWSEQVLQMPLAQGALLQIAVALGMVGGAVLAGRYLPTRHALAVLPLGLAIGLAVLAMVMVETVVAAALVLGLIGLLSGLFVVPMNALLQDRGNALMRPGQAVAVQNCNESLASLVLLAMYGGLLYLDAPLLPVIVGLALFVCVAMVAMILLQARRQRDFGKPRDEVAGIAAELRARSGENVM